MKEENTDFSDQGGENIYNDDFDINQVDGTIPTLVWSLNVL